MENKLVEISKIKFVTLYKHIFDILEMMEDENLNNEFKKINENIYADDNENFMYFRIKKLSDLVSFLWGLNMDITSYLNKHKDKQIRIRLHKESLYLDKLIHLIDEAEENNVISVNYQDKYMQVKIEDIDRLIDMTEKNLRLLIELKDKNLNNKGNK